MDGTGGDNTEQNKSKRERQILDGFIYIWIINKTNSQNSFN